MGYRRSRYPSSLLSRNMNNLIDALDHIQKATSLLGEDLVTLTRSSIDSLPAVALSEELLELHSVVSNLGSL